MRSTSAAAVIGITLTTLAGPARAEPGTSASLTPEERLAISEHIAPILAYTQDLKVEAGTTLYVVQSVEVSANRIRKLESDYEAIVTKMSSPTGVTVSKRVDLHKLTKKPNGVEVSFRYAITVDPRGASSGRIGVTLSLIERTGLANVAADVTAVHAITVVPAKHDARELGVDFWGYRMFAELGRQSLKELQNVGVKGLSLAEAAPLPKLDRIDGHTTEKLFELDRLRRRIASARRHLETALTGKDEKLAATARQYIALLDAPDDQVASLPKVALIDPKASAAPVNPATQLKSEVQGGVLQPLDTDAPKPEPDAFAQPEATPEGPKTPIAPVASAAPDPAPIDDKEDLSFVRKSKDELVPTYPRTLILDDPNIAAGAWVRFNFAQVADRHEATTPGWFFGAEAPLTNDLGVEVTVPTALVSVTDIDAAVPVFSMGNPLLTAKYRFHLPSIDGRRPLVTPRFHWAVPINAHNPIPRASEIAESFSFPAHIADTYAFALEKSAVGGGFGATYMNGMFQGSAQLYVNYFIPVENAIESTKFTTLNYGVSVGAHPFGELVGFFLEARGTAMFLGPVRTELFTYLGARGKLWDYFEPALWLSVPIGSVSRASPIQFGGELRVSYDFEGVISHGRERNQSLLEDR